jgi:hypothetical protein
MQSVDQHRLHAQVLCRSRDIIRSGITCLTAFKGGSMSDDKSATYGIELLVEKCRNEFRLHENTNHYTQDDYKEAERKYVKFCLNGDVDR